MTAIPLWIFAKGARRIPLKSVGFLQYLLPTLMLFVATVVYGEPFDTTRGIAFGVIWLALALYTATLLRRGRRGRGARPWRHADGGPRRIDSPPP